MKIHLAQYGVLFSLIVSAMVGGIMAIFTSILSYSTSTTPARFIALRMAVGEVLNAICKLITQLLYLMIFVKNFL